MESLLRLRARRRRSNLACVVWGRGSRLLNVDAMSEWLEELQHQTTSELREGGPLVLQSYTHPVDNTRYVVTYSEEQHDQ